MTMRSKEFDDWMTAQHPRYKPSDDSMDLRVAWSVWQAATERAAMTVMHAPAGTTRRGIAAAIRGQAT
jgi:hypothetical protein